MAQLLSQFPRASQVINKFTGWLEERWQQWFVQLSGLVNAAIVKPGSVSVQPGVGAVLATAIPLNSNMLGTIYRLNYSVQTTQAATINSNFQLTISWTSFGVVQSVALPAIVNGTPTDQQSGNLVMQVDPNTEITYAVDYASAGVTPMQYALDLTLERLE